MPEWLKQSFDSGALLRYAAACAAVAAFGFVALGSSAEKYAENGGSGLLSFVLPTKAESARPSHTFNAIDYATTGAIPGKQTLVVLGPCGEEAQKP